jgi:hypothetical protein
MPPLSRRHADVPLARQRAEARDPCCGGGGHARARAGGGCCGGKDMGPMSKYEEPSAEDLERFSDVTRTCPECKNEVHDDAEICYHCGHVFGASSLARVPPWVVALACLLALAMIFWFVR